MTFGGNSSMRVYRRLRPLAVLVCGVAVALAATTTAEAGTYMMRTCNVPGAPRSTIGPWSFFAGGGTFANDDCAVGGGFGLNAGTMTSGYAASVAFGTDPAIAIRRVRLWLIARLAGGGSPMNVTVQWGDATVAQPA